MDDENIQIVINNSLRVILKDTDQQRFKQNTIEERAFFEDPEGTQSKAYQNQMVMFR